MKTFEAGCQKQLEGILVINKPSGMTSHDVVGCIRRKFHMRRVGHAGTLDPMATGVLVILLGKATKLFKKFESFDKAYKATMILGKKTTTADIQGEVIEECSYREITKEKIEQIMPEFVGEVEQVPPMVSAVKIKGKKLYELARKGIHVPRTPRKIRINILKMSDFHPPCVKFYLECSKGTYVRQLAEDIGQRLNTVACISQIERTRVGPFTLEQSVTLDDVSLHHVQEWPKK